jgi:acetoin utilization protein AcuC
MDHRAVIAHHPDFLHYDFGPQHPLRPERIVAGLDLLQSAGLWDPERELLRPSPASRAELELVHDPAFINAVEEASTDWFPAVELRRFGLGPGDNPAFPGMHEAAAVVTGGSVAAVRQVMSGEVAHAFNPAGGLHHASRSRASGFCIYDDPAVAAAVAVREFDARVLYVDVDCHHGDGVQWIFYESPEVLTISFHESGRYLFPGTGDVTETGRGKGSGYAVNVPMAPYTQDRSWLDAVETIVPPLAARFAPDLVISAHGADTHIWDPLTHLCLTTSAFADQARLIHRLAHQYAAGRWLAVGSGGYDWRRVVPRSWTILWAEMTGRPLPHTLPEDWRSRWSPGADTPFPSTYLDDTSLAAPMPRAAEIAALNARTLASACALAGLSSDETREPSSRYIPGVDDFVGES